MFVHHFTACNDVVHWKDDTPPKKKNRLQQEEDEKYDLQSLELMEVIILQEQAMKKQDNKRKNLLLEKKQKEIREQQRILEGAKTAIFFNSLQMICEDADYKEVLYKQVILDLINEIIERN